MLNSPVTRRFCLQGSLATAFAALTTSPALALTQNGATALVRQVVDEINRVIASGQSEAAMIRDFERLFTRYADVPIMARYALGPDARTVSAAEMQRFTNAFSGYIANKYGRRFREFIGGSVEVTSARAIKNGYEVRSTVKLRGEAPFEMSLLVSDRSGSDKFYNLFIEGVNLLLTERTEIGALLDRNGGNVNKMITALEGMS
ncbi:MlaC/ttg2D family ABC transporter substrate-binding protein [Marinibacterium profundimaris]|uniref:ABC transporter n=1 Tax=Marinibacterium profundimaris TaxID=1679460 RepID=A0A225NN90_9RHOB|nr:ABC transporter substrate-binding protein [Marinibacterium profundimaris]OWU75984.1 ABC transporter [Marinibacterium profundimaris]